MMNIRIHTIKMRLSSTYQYVNVYLDLAIFCHAYQAACFPALHHCSSDHVNLKTHLHKVDATIMT